jgi:hypothetical protein
MIGLSLSSVSKHNIWSYYDWVYCLPTVNTICGRIMIGLSLLSSVSKHNMWSYYVSVYCLPSVNTICDRIMIGLLTEDNDNPIIIRPHIMFTDGRQQRQSNHNTITYCVYWRKTINRNIIRPHIVFTDGRQQRQPNHNTTTYCVYWWKTINPASTLRIPNVAVWLLFGQVPFLRENYVATTYLKYVLCNSSLSGRKNYVRVSR